MSSKSCGREKAAAGEKQPEVRMCNPSIQWKCSDPKEKEGNYAPTSLCDTMVPHHMKYSTGKQEGKREIIPS